MRISATETCHNLDGSPSSNTSHFTNTTSKGEKKYKYKDLTKAPNFVKMLNNKWSRSFPLQRFRVATRICLQHDKKFHRTDESLMESNAFKHKLKKECRNIICQSNRCYSVCHVMNCLCWWCCHFLCRNVNNILCESCRDRWMNMSNTRQEVMLFLCILKSLMVMVNIIQQAPI